MTNYAPTSCVLKNLRLEDKDLKSEDKDKVWYGIVGFNVPIDTL